MREIKFRAWNKILKQFVPVWSAIETRGDDVLRPINYDFILEQYTGLKDKNGVEIYEGDVVKTFGFNPYTVEFFDGSFNPVSSLESSEWEVIGNIHENANLLEEQ